MNKIMMDALEGSSGFLEQSPFYNETGKRRVRG
jgi:hypothetical protein